MPQWLTLIINNVGDSCTVILAKPQTKKWATFPLGILTPFGFGVGCSERMSPQTNPHIGVLAWCHIGIATSPTDVGYEGLRLGPR